MRIEIAEIENRNLYRVWHDGAVIIERTTSPMRAAARVLLMRGVANLDDVLEMTRRGSNQVDLLATISDAALLEAPTEPDEGDADPDGLSDSPEVPEATPPALKTAAVPSEWDSAKPGPR